MVSMITPEALAKLNENIVQIISIIKKIDNHIKRMSIACSVASTIISEISQNTAEKIGMIETIKQYYFEIGLPERIRPELMKQEAEKDE